MKRAIFSVLVISLGLLLKTCNTTEPPSPPDGEKPTLALKLEDVSCTEAWIELNTTNLQLPAEINLIKNDNVAQTISLSKADTLLYIDSLLPNQSYKYQVSSIQHQVSSNELSVTTMDTTSHDFTFETFTFGGTAGSSVIYDVAIINENNIWAVGEIYVADTSQNSYTMYNAVHWDGSQWELKRIMFYTICGQQHQNAYPASSIFAFSGNDIWVGMQGSQIARLNDATQIGTYCIPISVRKLWGSDNQNFYAVGINGQIAHYNGTRWSRIESGTELNINDIWGDYNEKTGEWEILAVASNKFLNEGKKILKIDGLISTELSTIGLPWSLSSIWFQVEKKYYVGGDGLYFKKLLNDSWVKDLTFIPIYKDRIRGTNLNNIVVSGSNGLLSHFNGMNWKHYINNELPYYSGRLLSCDIKDNIIVAVGWKEIEAIITMGKR